MTRCGSKRWLCCQSQPLDVFLAFVRFRICFELTTLDPLDLEEAELSYDKELADEDSSNEASV